MNERNPCEHEWDSGDRWGIILGVSRCKKCEELAKQADFPQRRTYETIDGEPCDGNGRIFPE